MRVYFIIRETENLKGVSVWSVWGSRTCFLICWFGC